MKLGTEEVRILGNHRYAQKRHKEGEVAIGIGVGCMVVGLVLILVIGMTTAIAPLTQQGTATYLITEPGELVITDYSSVRFNGEKIPVIYESATDSPSVGDWIILGIGGVLAVIGICLFFSSADWVNDRRNEFADKFVQQWLDTGELPPKESEK